MGVTMQTKVLDIFNNNIFSIPDYQRDYAWEEKNLEDLWEDLLEAELNTSDTMGHFLGTIVISKNPKDPNVYDIIDGQQRATTIFMLRYTLNSKTKDPKRNINYFLDDDDKPRLRVISKNREFFNKILEKADNRQLHPDLEKEAKTEGQRRLYKVFSCILDIINSLNENEAKTKLEVLNNMILMKLEEKDSGRAIRIFQSVNDRGVALELLDKLKALLMLYSNKYCNGELDDTINERFGEIFKTASELKKQKVANSMGDSEFVKYIENRIFNYHALGQKEIGNYRYGADSSYTELKKVLKEKIKSKIDADELKQWLDEYSKDLLAFFRAFLEVMKLAEKNKEALKLLFVLKINPYFYSSLIRMQMNGLLDDEVLRLFAIAEICCYGLGSTNDSSAYKLYETTNSKEEFKEAVLELCKKCKKGGYRNIEDALDSRYDCYGWGKYFHYLFLVYRADCMDINELMSLLEVDNKTYSMTIEHIISQNTKNNGSLKQYGFITKDKDGNEIEDQEKFEVYKNNFGNLLALESKINKELQDKGLVEKQVGYKKSKISYNREFASREDFLSFSKDTIIEENEKFIKWAKEVFFKDFL